MLRAVLILVAVVPAWAASKPHVIAFGKAQPVKISFGPEETQTVSINVRPLYIDAKLKDYTTGATHDITDHLFVVQRVYRLNDSLPADNPKQPRWIWLRGGWLLVDRSTGHVAQLKLPEFDPAVSDPVWYRDFAAYCGASENGERSSAVVWQIGTRRAVYQKELGRTQPDAVAACGIPRWERNPPRVTFIPRQGEAFTINVATRQLAEPAEPPAEQ